MTVSESALSLSDMDGHVEHVCWLIDLQDTSNDTRKQHARGRKESDNAYHTFPSNLP